MIPGYKLPLSNGFKQKGWIEAHLRALIDRSHPHNSLFALAYFGTASNLSLP